jgi:predicted nucleic-acid-binding Zn-ribbon protein
MIRKNKYRILTIIALCSAIWAACTQTRTQCFTPTIASLNLVCMHLTTDTGTIFSDTALPAAFWVAFTNSGPKATLYSTQNSNFTISLSSDNDTCKWGLTTDTTISTINKTNIDTLTFIYKQHLQFISNACGYAYFYNLDTVITTHKIIDSVLITNPSVTNNVNTTQLQIYIHPDF